MIASGATRAVGWMAIREAVSGWRLAVGAEAIYLRSRRRTVARLNYDSGSPPTANRQPLTASSSLPWRHHHLGAGDFLAFDLGERRELPDTAQRALQRRLHDELVAGQHGAAEARLVDTDE